MTEIKLPVCVSIDACGFQTGAYVTLTDEVLAQIAANTPKHGNGEPINPETLASIKTGMEQSAAGLVSEPMDFSKFVDELGSHTKLEELRELAYVPDSEGVTERELRLSSQAECRALKEELNQAYGRISRKEAALKDAERKLIHKDGACKQYHDAWNNAEAALKKEQNDSEIRQGTVNYLNDTLKSLEKKYATAVKQLQVIKGVLDV